MKILAIEAGGQHCSVALYLDGHIHQNLEDLQASKHSERLLPMQAQLMQAHSLRLNDLDFIACGIGPGTFTGIRVATALCQGLAFGGNLPAVGVSSLAALAWAAAQQQSCRQVMPMVDARMQEVYWALYAFERGDLSPLVAESLSTAADLRTTVALQDCLGVGSGWKEYSSNLSELSKQCKLILEEKTVQARDIAALAAHWVSQGRLAPGAAQDLQPLYVRNQVTQPA